MIPAQTQVDIDDIDWGDIEDMPPSTQSAGAAETYRLVISHPSTPMPTYRAMEHLWRHDGVPTLVRWRDQWWRWSGYSWAPIDDAELTRDLYEMTEHAVYEMVTATKTEEIPWSPEVGRIRKLEHVMSSLMIRPSHVQMPSWTGPRDYGPAVSCLNGILLLHDRYPDGRPRMIRQTPELFTPGHVECDYNHEATCPQWLQFLRDVLVDDDQIALLQEWFGYVLSGRMDQHKLMLMIGKPRSGKGTIVHILTSLMGQRNVASPSGRSFDAQFGLSSLIGKPLGVVPDLRSDRPLSASATESLLAISSGDAVDIDRKHRPIWTGVLPTRMMMLSNEAPRFKDASAAVVTRCLALTFPRSFLGHEDRTLRTRIESELSGILTWAIAGELRLTQQGTFTPTTRSADVLEAMTHSASPIRAWIADTCVIDPSARTDTDTLYTSYRGWTEDQGLSPMSKIEFGRAMSAAEDGYSMGRFYVDSKRVRGAVGLRIA